MINPDHPIFGDIITLRNAVRDNLAIIRPTAFNKMQLDELRYYLEVYEKELVRLSAGLPDIHCKTLTNQIEAKQNYERHESFSDKNRGI